MILNARLLLLLSFSLLSFTEFASSSVLQSNKLSFSVLITAESSGSLEAIVVEDGSWSTKRKLVHTAVLVKHPKGEFLFDSGIGRDFEEQMSVFSFFEKQLFKIENVLPARDQFNEQGYDVNRLMAIIPSHMHWDHASALEDFSGVPVWLQKSSLEEAQQGQPPAFVSSQYDDPSLIWNFFALTDAPYEGFAQSLDVFNDGSVVLVDLSGHTKGQVGLFLNLDSGKRYFFIGDTSWAQLGIKHNKPRPKFVHWLVGVDSNYEKNNQVVQSIHNFSLEHPDVVIVPAHDEIVAKTLPRYPNFSN
tara:strand:+ start:1167 stop:2075 length:909 start_codon:yes stop_codon:yes gene_type:complete